jgi:hypothetical protein
MASSGYSPNSSTVPAGRWSGWSGVALFDEFPHPSTGSGPDYLARLARQLGIKELEARWRKVTGRRLPRAVRDYVDVRAYRPGSRRHSRRSR